MTNGRLLWADDEMELLRAHLLFLEKKGYEVVMVTKSEEEDIMNQAIGQQIADYLIKPVNPNQILLTLKKNIHRREIVTETVQQGYQQQFQQIAMQIMDCRTWQEWTEVYKRLVRWEPKLCASVVKNKAPVPRCTGRLWKQVHSSATFFARNVRQSQIYFLSLWPETFQTSLWKQQYSTPSSSTC